ncbi:MAG TPA: hypothetical protein VGN70_02125 [Gammaproteobacteria bacterium]
MKAQAKRPTPSNDVGLDEALAGTFPASDPVAPPSHIEEEMERRRRVLDEDAANRRKDSAEEALDEALEETFPASDPIAVHHSEAREMPNPDDKDEHKERRSVRRKRPAGKKNKIAKKKPARSKKVAKKKPGKKKTARRTTNKKKRSR